MADGEKRFVCFGKKSFCDAHCLGSAFQFYDGKGGEYRSVSDDPASNNVNHPSHYNQGKYECIEVMAETFGTEATKHFCLLNAFKYIWRTGEKNGAEDVKKAIWYLQKLLELNGES